VLPGVTALVAAGADGMICHWNRGAEALTGHPAAAVPVTRPRAIRPCSLGQPGSRNSA